MSEDSAVHFSGESDSYREARNQLLDAERELRRNVARVAALRQSLPDGRRVDTDYVFDEIDPNSGKMSVSLSDLFVLPEKSLVVYSFMYPEGANPCPMCTSFLDSFNGVALHAQSQTNLAVIARGSIAQVSLWASERGWDHLRMLSSANCDFNRDYLAETGDGSQIPMLTVFRRDGDSIRHFYSTELFYSENEPDQHPRHVDMIFPLWNLFDLTPEGRPENGFPQLRYDDASAPRSGGTR